MRLYALTGVIAIALVAPLGAQGIPVVDIANIAQIGQMVEHTLQTLATAKKYYDLTMKMAEGIEDLTGYRIPTVATFNHDVGRFDFGAPWLEGLNGGDPRGDRYFKVVRKLKPVGSLLQELPPDARQAVEAAYATIEILDSVAMMGGHQSAIVRGYHGKLQAAVDLLENDIVSKVPGMKNLTAIADKIAVGQVINRRSDMAANQLISNILEQQIAASKRKRDAEAASMNSRLNAIADHGETQKALMIGATDAITNWTLP